MTDPRSTEEIARGIRETHLFTVSLAAAAGKKGDLKEACDLAEQAISAALTSERERGLSTSSDARGGSHFESRILSALAPGEGEELFWRCGECGTETALKNCPVCAPASPEKDEPVAWQSSIFLHDEEAWSWWSECDKDQALYILKHGQTFGANPVRARVRGLFTAPPSLAEAVAALKEAREYIIKIGPTGSPLYERLAKIDAALAKLEPKS